MAKLQSLFLSLLGLREIPFIKIMPNITREQISEMMSFEVPENTASLRKTYILPDVYSHSNLRGSVETFKNNF